MSDLTEHARRNREFWDRQSEEYEQRNRAFIERGLAWGVWQVPESELQVLGDVAGKDVLELGCGAAEWSRALTRLGARCVGLDNSESRLARAREALERDRLDVRLVHASAESVPLPDASFDLVMADWGAPTFADPYLLVPEVARLLRPGGVFAFSGGTAIEWCCYDPGAEHPVPRLVSDYFGMRRWDDPDGSVSFMLGYGDWIRIFRRTGLAVEDLVEIRPPEDATSTYRDATDLEWARRWPMEQIWKVRKA